MEVIIYQEYIKSNKEQFIAKTKEICLKLGIQVNWLMAIMYIESKLDPQMKSKTSSAVGLIQFLKRTAEGLGTTRDQLLQMTNVEQLDYVYLYLNDYKKKLKSFVDVYFTIFHPVAVGKYHDYVLGSLGGDAAKIARANSSMDFDSNEEVTKMEVQRKLLLAIKPEYHKYLI